MKIRINTETILVCFALTLFVGQSNAAPTILSAEQWREDISQLNDAILETHPLPFAHADEAGYKTAVESVLSDLAHLTDKQIIIRLASIVAMINDGHTRLTIPLKNADVGVTIGHSNDPAPSNTELSFSRLPIQFESFVDGVFVSQSTPEYAKYIGWKLVRIGEMSAGEAMVSANTISYAANEQFAQLQAADRLSILDVLFVLGVSSNAEQISMVLANPDGQHLELELSAISGESISWHTAFGGVMEPLRTRNPSKLLWSQFLPDENIVYAQVDEIGDDDGMRFAEFAVSIVAEAERRKARLVIDLRSNFGGSGDLNRSLILAILQSEQLNQYGRIFILTGRRTFSAAQLLVNTLEAYSRVLFVGEPTGARPDHYGDAKKMQLEHSGITLRVSSLHWSSFFSNDARKALNPDLPTPWASADYFAGRDPALTAAAKFDGDFQSLVQGSFERDDHYQVGRHLLNARLFPDTADQSVAATILAVSDHFSAIGKVDNADVVLQYGLFFHPDDIALKTAMEKLKEESKADE